MIEEKGELETKLERLIVECFPSGHGIYSLEEFRKVKENVIKVLLQFRMDLMSINDEHPECTAEFIDSIRKRIRDWMSVDI